MEREQFAQLLTDALGDDIENLTDDEARLAAELVSAIVPTRPRSPWAELIGPVYSWRGAARLLGLQNRQSVDVRRKNQRLLGIKTADGNWAYPAAQFRVRNGSPAVLDHLDAVLAELVPAADGLGAARWIMTGNRQLAGRRPLDVLDGGDPNEVADVVKLAEEQAGFWSGRTHR